ncbi:TetR/AcrR family transcriptional regulator [Aestuariicella sp. G3-2]|uniref:TetR/AcrR family transcriptional regulator n=1 Tax=Pseudomaricurvus albidus TaxID=2842452 RepID=UPI001C0DEE5F|nr:TetR/AcrR family transcriptional regulator [Aestuariicella albida]MBU3069296.1 TetR/AcrR family transcriptional regulator [Aestuariicella albida]
MMSNSEKQDRRNISPETLELLRTTVIELFSQGLFHKVGIRDIAKQAGVGPQTIYKYFGNKDSLIFACITPELTELEHSIRTEVEKHPDNALMQLDAFINTFVSFYLTHRELAEIVFLTIPARQRITDPAFSDRYLVKLLEEILYEGQKQGRVRKDVPAFDLHDTLLGAFTQYIIRKLFQPEVSDIPAECERLTRMVRPLITG